MKASPSTYTPLQSLAVFAFLLITCTFFNRTFGQTVVIPDANFRTCLVNDYPTLMDGSQELIITQAQGFTGTLLCDNQNIEDISGVEHFTSVTVIDFSKNDIVDITGIANLSTLEEFYIFNNDLEIVPDLSSLSSLKVFQGNYNQLDNPPILSSSIEELHLGNNSLGGTIDVSNYTNLTRLELFENDIQELNGFENLTKLERAILYTNELKEPKDLSALTLLKRLDISNNEYKDLPTLSSSILEEVKIGENMLTFDDFLTVADLSMFPTAFPDFDNQLIREDSLHFVEDEGKDWTWTLDFDQLVSNNTYTWHLNASVKTSTSSGTLNLTDLTASDSGRYYCSVTNDHPKLSGITIMTNPHFLNITPKNTDPDTTSPTCFDLIDVSVSVETPPCRRVATLKLIAYTSGTLQGAQTYALALNNDTIKSSSGTFELDQEGIYHVIVMDDVCSSVSPNTTSIDFDLDNCEPPSFSPNGDGLDDSYYIDGNGTAVIFDKSGKEITQIPTPGYWNGTDANNNLVDLGIYFIVIGDTKEKVTVMR